MRPGAPGPVLRIGTVMAASDSRQLLPTEVAGWRAGDAGVRYDPESIFGYLDGHAEVYLAYGMRSCLARRYGGPDDEGDLILDVFEMASPADAFGVFTHDQDGEPFEIGQGALFRSGWLSFWKGRFFVSVYAEQDTRRSRAAVLELGRAVATTIVETGSAPELVARLPREGLEPRSVRFLRHPQILNTHVRLGADNLLRLGPQSAAALGRYRRRGQRGLLLLVEYRRASDAQAAAAAFAERFLRAGAPARSKDGWCALRRLSGDGGTLGLVVGADSRALAEALLSDARAATEGGKR